MNVFNNFLGKTLLKSQMKKAGVPADQQDKLIQMIAANPELFQKIADEAKTKMDAGMSQEQAMMAVMNDNKEEIQKALSAS